MAFQRLAYSGMATFVVLAMASLPAHAADKKTKPLPKPTPPGIARKAAAALPPQIYQVNPTKVNPTTQPNIMILGQHLTETTTVQVGGVPATTVQVPDPNHLLVKLPNNLSQGTYTVQVTNEAGTAVASDPLVVDGAGNQFSPLQIAAGAGFLLFLVLVMRLSRTPGLS
ncbi:MAG TPA: IPT/TIG domain-containing protein [Candidatus Dormibacteraeota bacterium]|nr:IPT/TIG domain-containing protein [Candidatus Dormibacteraeota bacterium]